MKKDIRTQLSQKDAVLTDIMAQIPWPEIESTHNVFNDLMSCLIEQQIHYRSSKKTFQKIMQTASLDQLRVQNFSQLEESGLQQVKLSMQKYKAILSALDFFKENEIAWADKTDKEVREILGQIKGVGSWTIDMILLYTLERENIFPADDYHLRLIMTKLYTLDPQARLKAQQKAVAEHWVPYKSFAVKYLLAYKDHLKGKGR